ncbi:MAG: BatA domain-containing protein, partial [Planctomycetota bacterium]|nr:BatA domain-containing protein [Planctomycetota bacterium]
MAFLNFVLLGGIGAAVVPLIIHLLHRSRYQVVKWGAMHLLADVIRVQRRRLRLEQILLLLVRMAIPACLALCLARPVFTAGSALWGSGRVSLVIAFDNSLSMNAVPGVRSNLAHAREEAERIIDRLDRGSEAALVMLAAKATGAEERPSFDLSAVRRQIQAVNEGSGFADPAVGLATAAGIFAHMTHAARELVI